MFGVCFAELCLMLVKEKHYDNPGLGTCNFAFIGDKYEDHSYVPTPECTRLETEVAPDFRSIL